MNSIERFVRKAIQSGTKEITLKVNRDYQPNIRAGLGPTGQNTDHIAKIYLENHRPSFWTKVGLVQANRTRIAISPKTGELVGYNDLVVRDPYTGIYEITTYLYRYHNGNIQKLKEFPTRFAERAPA